MAATPPPPVAALEQLSSSKMFGGHNLRFRHQSATLGCPMTFSVYLPPSPASSIPVLYWLSGLTCTDENFIIKSGAQRAAAAHGIALVAPDTSPRMSMLKLLLSPRSVPRVYACGLNIEGESDSYDFGVGAGFYLNATNEKWKNWRMYDYVVKELPKVLSDHFEQLNTAHASIFGHSMGGHGALTVYLKNTDKYKSVSAFAPITNPINCPWGQKAFSNYLGSTKSDWEDYDATCLIKKNNNVSNPILIDQGEDDKFLAEQLIPCNFEEACKAVGVPLILRMQPGYDHSYFFIATFIDDHIAHHAQFLKSA
ncbi:hypothetical protein HU200_064788 [Digitaria exilis]|uniref:S-formylglutathione hydrolase n=1 Tax=Digitaria exilis TaxID=1010633 RepID=A0A835DVD7_9POAL|nr:hypothetical protein HU200_064788 [Digitaria exilis]